jgi:predicted N-acetyltransferase YhbS
MEIRLARRGDIDQLVAMRRDFTFEDYEGEERPGYEADCRAFLEDALASGRWQIWVAVDGDEVVSHMYVALVDKVPRPVSEKRRIAYLTNVYTRPGYRGRGIGGELLRRVQAAAEDAAVELVIVWPSETSVAFYERAGFAPPDDPLIWHSAL